MRTDTCLWRSLRQMNSEGGRDAESNGLKVVVVDYGSGNLRSVARALEKAGVSPVISGDPQGALQRRTPWCFRGWAQGILP